MLYLLQYNIAVTVIYCDTYSAIASTALRCSW